MSKGKEESTKEQANGLKSLIANIFMSINQENNRKGINVTYKYGFKSTEESMSCSFTIEELGYPSRTIQELAFSKDKSKSRFENETALAFAVLVFLTDNAMFSLDAMSKHLQVDPKLQEQARKTQA